MGLIHASAEVDPGARVDPTAFIWGLAHVREGASIGPATIIGRGAYVGVGVIVGARVKIQNYAQVFEPARIGEGAFIGPGAILTNDTHPRSVTPDGVLKSASDWRAEGVLVGMGASIGAGAICVAPVSIGEWALVGAGAVVTRSVPPYALVVGAPARQVGWVGRAGKKLEFDEGIALWVCPETGDRYRDHRYRLERLEVTP